MTEVTSPHFWSQFGAPSAVDFCEGNFKVSAYVAEFANSLSALGMSIYGVLGLVHARRQKYPLVLALPFAFLIAVGLGSAAFHSTLLLHAQLLDEVPMCLCGCAMVVSSVLSKDDQTRGLQRQKKEKRLVRYLLAFCLAYLVLYIFLPDVFRMLSIISVSVGCFFVVLFNTAQPWKRTTDRAARTLVVAGAVLLSTSFGILWQIDYHFCTEVVSMLGLHAIFHLASALGVHLVAMFFVYCHYTRFGEFTLPLADSICAESESEETGGTPATRKIVSSSEASAETDCKDAQVPAVTSSETRVAAGPRPKKCAEVRWEGTLPFVVQIKRDD